MCLVQLRQEIGKVRHIGTVRRRGAQVFQLLRAGSSARRVATYLADVEVEQMGLERHPDRVDSLTETVAAKLVALPVPPRRRG
jgi:hypothetical protein